MTMYRRIWTLAAGIGCATGLVVAGSSWHPLVLLGVAVAGGLLGMAVVLPCIPETEPWVVPTFKAMTVSGLLTLVLLGVGHLFGAPGVGAIVLLAVTCPALAPGYAWLAAHSGRVGRAGRRWMLRATPGTEERQAAAQPAWGSVAVSAAPVAVFESAAFDVPDLMTDADLCHAWRSSYVALQRSRTTESRLRAVAVRAIYLDELERRDEPAVRAWLASGARAASDPGRFLFPGVFPY